MENEQSNIPNEGGVSKKKSIYFWPYRLWK